MFRKLKSKIRRRKLTKLVKDHASEIIVGMAVGLLTDILTDVAHSKLQRKLGRRLRA